MSGSAKSSSRIPSSVSAVISAFASLPNGSIISVARFFSVTTFQKPAVNPSIRNVRTLTLCGTGTFGPPRKMRSRLAKPRVTLS